MSRIMFCWKGELAWRQSFARQAA